MGALDLAAMQRFNLAADHATDKCTPATSRADLMLR